MIRLLLRLAAVEGQSLAVLRTITATAFRVDQAVGQDTQTERGLAVPRLRGKETQEVIHQVPPRLQQVVAALVQLARTIKAMTAVQAARASTLAQRSALASGIAACSLEVAVAEAGTTLAALVAPGAGAMAVANLAAFPRKTEQLTPAAVAEAGPTTTEQAVTEVRELLF